MNAIIEAAVGVQPLESEGNEQLGRKDKEQKYKRKRYLWYY